MLGTIVRYGGALTGFGPALKYAAIGLAGILAFAFVRHDAADDARNEITAAVQQETLKEVVRQQDAAAEVQKAAAERKAENDANLKELIDELPELVEGADCAISDDAFERLLRLNE